MAQISRKQTVEVAPPLSRSPEREALAAAIEKHIACTATLAHAQEASKRAYDFWSNAVQTVATAESALREAKDQEPQRLVERFMSDRAGDDSNPVAAAKDVLKKAEGNLLAVKESRNLLEKVVTDAEQPLFWAKHRVNEAVRLVLATDPAIAAFVTEFETTQRRFNDLLGVASLIGLSKLSKTLDGRNSPSAPAWSAVIAALATNADAPLPAVN